MNAYDGLSISFMAFNALDRKPPFGFSAGLGCGSGVGWVAGADLTSGAT
jgi:hypothetical protein